MKFSSTLPLTPLPGGHTLNPGVIRHWEKPHT